MFVTGNPLAIFHTTIGVVYFSGLCSETYINALIWELQLWEGKRSMFFAQGHLENGPLNPVILHL